jgi:hypothetical protein
MSRLAKVMATVAFVLVAAPIASSASAYNTVPCWASDDSGYHAVLKHKPRKCTLGGRYGYQQVDVIRMRWRSWGGENAVGRGVSVANMGRASEGARPTVPAGALGGGHVPVHTSEVQVQWGRMGTAARAPDWLAGLP